MSILWTAAEIAEATQGACSGTWNVTGLSIDSRTVKEGDLFIPLKGPNFDGHDYVADALAKGAAGALVDRALPGVTAEKLVKVADTFRALEMLGIAGRRRSAAKIIAVTGSVGKTGCKEALRQVLGAQAPTYANEGSFNNHWGVPLSLARMPRESRYGVFEVGMNHMGELGPLSKMVQPHIVLITTIAPVHIGNFESMDGIAAAKAEIFDGVGTDGHVVIDGDNAYADFLYARAKEKRIAHIHRFGKTVTADAQIISRALHADGSDVNARILGKGVSYHVAAAGEHWVKNSLAVLLCASLAGADLAQAAESLRSLQLAHGRGVTKDIAFAKGRFTLIDESYNASPVAVDMAIRVLAKKQPSGAGRRLLALADMRELGAQAQDLHMALVKTIPEAGIAKVFCCGEMTKHLFDALPVDMRGGYAFTSAELAPMVAAAMTDGDIITVKGSHSMMMEKVVAALEALDREETGARKRMGSA